MEPIVSPVQPGSRSRWLKRLVALVLWGAATAVVAILILMVAYRFVAPPVSTLMLWRMMQGNGIDYRWVALDDIAPELVDAVIASEDARFCTHHGVDWEAIGAVVDAMADDPDAAPRGASTIAMQTVKNLFLWPSRSYLRKGLEIPLAYLADAVWPKRRMIEIYLNVVEWGPGIYGAQAAAMAHFGKPARALGAAEAALMAATLPNPLVREAGRPGPLTRRVATTVRARMRDIGPHLGCLGTRSRT